MYSPKHWWMEDHCRLSSSSATLYHGYFYLLKANFAKQFQWKMFKLNWQWWCIINIYFFLFSGLLQGFCFQRWKQSLCSLFILKEVTWTHLPPLVSTRTAFAFRLISHYQIKYFKPSIEILLQTFMTNSAYRIVFNQT